MSEYYTIKELAKRWKVSDDTVRRRMKEIPNLQIAYIGRLVRISEEEATRLLKYVRTYGRQK